MWRLAVCGLVFLATAFGCHARTAASGDVQPARCPAKAPEGGVHRNSWSRARRTLAPRGPTAIRLCRYPGLNGPIRPGKLVRSRLLRDGTQVARLVNEFDELKSVPPGAVACPMDDGSFILALLAYPDGHRVKIGVERTGCQTVSNGDVVRTASGYGTPVGPKLERQLGRLTS